MESKQIAIRARRFGVRMIAVHDGMIRRGGAARTLAPQVLRSAVSIGANLEEATAGQTKADFVAKVSIARKEARETAYWLLLIIEGDLLPRDMIESELDEANQLAAILGTIILRATSNPNRGR